MGGSGEGGLGLGDVYGKLVVLLRFGCCISKRRCINLRLVPALGSCVRGERRRG